MPTLEHDIEEVPEPAPHPDLPAPDVLEKMTWDEREKLRQAGILRPEHRPFRCKVCTRTYRYRPTHECRGYADYEWWDRVPSHLKTKTALGELGLKPGPDAKKPTHRALCSFLSGYGRYRNEKVYLLYDMGEAVPKRKPTEAQLAALAKAQITLRTCTSCFQVVEKRAQLEYRTCQACLEKARIRGEREREGDVIEWARAMLAKPDLRVLDTETTDLDGELLEISILDRDGNALYDSLIRPESVIPNVSAGDFPATFIHGITQKDVWAAPTMREAWPIIAPLLQDKTIVTYNASFDSGMVEKGVEMAHCEPLVPEPEQPIGSHYINDPNDPTKRIYLSYPACLEPGSPERIQWDAQYEAWATAVKENNRRRDAGRKAAEPILKSMDWECLMEEFAVYYGEWSDYHGSYKWQRLNGGHRALGDAQAALSLLKRIANDRLLSEDEQEAVAIK